MQQIKQKQMKNDLSFINTDADLDREITSAQERIANGKLQLKEDAKQLPGEVLTNAAQKIKPYLASGISMAIGAMLVRKLVNRRKSKLAATSSPFSLSSIAINSLPFVLMVAKKIIQNKREKANRVASLTTE